jgi:hypothetical protein
MLPILTTLPLTTCAKKPYNNGMNIEKIITDLCGWGFWNHRSPNFIDPYNFNIIAGIGLQINEKHLALTVKQQNLAVTILKKYSAKISDLLGKDISEHLKTPVFSMGTRVINSDHKVQIHTVNDVKKIQVSFPFNERIVAAIKDYNRVSQKERYIQTQYADLLQITWNHDNRSWDFPLSEEHILWIVNNLSGFTYDEEFGNYADEIKRIEASIEEYTPMVVYNDGKFSFKNTHSKVPQPTGDNLLDVMFMAKTYGISVWDEAIDLALNSPDISPVVAKVLKHNNKKPLVLEDQYSKLENLREIVALSKNVLFVIPGGSELSHLKATHTWLNYEKYENKQVSVLFRLDSSSGKICNDYIKENKLNTPLSDEVKFVFISGKIPKPLIEINKLFDTVVYFGTNSAHYTLKNFIENHHNVISMTLTPENRELNFCRPVK